MTLLGITLVIIGLFVDMGWFFSGIVIVIGIIMVVKASRSQSKEDSLFIKMFKEQNGYHE